MLADVRLKFSDLYREIEALADPFDVPLMLSLAPEDQKTFLVNVLDLRKQTDRQSENTGTSWKHL
jgi:hypothetical protein